MGNQKGLAPVLIIIISLIILGAAVFGYKTYKNSSVPSVSQEITEENSSTNINEATNSPSLNLTTATQKTSTPKSTCNKDNDVCFSDPNPTITIQEGRLDDYNYWISDQLKLIGKGSGGYEVKITGFPKEFSVRPSDQNFKDGGESSIYLRAQKDITKKGSYTGAISVKSYISGITTTVPLTIKYTVWDSSAINAVPSQITLDCTIKYNVNGVDKRQLDCGKWDDRYLKFYYFNNDKIVETRPTPDGDKKRYITLLTEYVNGNTLPKGQSVYTFRFDPNSEIYSNLLNEPDGVYKGRILFVDQMTQKTLYSVLYTLTIHAYKP